MFGGQHGRDHPGINRSAKTSTLEGLRKIDAWWRAANYLSVGQIYLRDNPLLREPLTIEHVKSRLLGHWGTTPGLNFIYAHMNRLESAFILEMVPMSLIFALIGGSIGTAFAIYHLALVRQQRTVQYLEKELAEDLPSLIKGGEGEHMEFKSSVRWDFHQQKLNRALEVVIAKTIVGFMNHRGGSLLIGVTDDGKIAGLENDYETLKHRDRDGFERCIMDIVTSRLGVDLCSFIHCGFHDIEGSDVCRIIIESSSVPVYLHDGKISKYYVRVGNSTRELDAREAMLHVTMR